VSSDLIVALGVVTFFYLIQLLGVSIAVYEGEIKTKAKFFYWSIPYLGLIVLIIKFFGGVFSKVRKMK